MAAAGGEASGDLSAFNAGFEHRTGFEWLSRDEAEVDLYVADPWCGFEASPDVMPQMFGSATRLADRTVLGGIRSDLPILIVSGDADPLAGGGALIEAVGAALPRRRDHRRDRTAVPGGAARDLQRDQP